MTGFWIEVLNGRYAGMIARACLGDTIRIGTRRGLELCVADDPSLAGQHFALLSEREGIRCFPLQGEVKRLENRTIHERFQHREVLIAGQTAFLISEIDGRWWPGDPVGPIDILRGMLRKEGGNIYALFDPVPDAILTDWIGEQCEVHRFSGGELPGREAMLVSCPKQDGLLDPLIRHGWGRGLLVFGLSPLPAEEVAGGLREVWGAGFPGHERWRLRMQDPRFVRVLGRRQPGALSAAYAKVFSEIWVEGRFPSLVHRVEWPDGVEKWTAHRLDSEERPLPTQAEIAAMMAQQNGMPLGELVVALTAAQGNPLPAAEAESILTEAGALGLSDPAGKVQFSCAAAAGGRFWESGEYQALNEKCGGPGPALDRFVISWNRRVAGPFGGKEQTPWIGDGR